MFNCTPHLYPNKILGRCLSQSYVCLGLSNKIVSPCLKVLTSLSTITLHLGHLGAMYQDVQSPSSCTTNQNQQTTLSHYWEKNIWEAKFIDDFILQKFSNSLCVMVYDCFCFTPFGIMVYGNQNILVTILRFRKKTNFVKRYLIKLIPNWDTVEFYRFRPNITRAFNQLKLLARSHHILNFLSPIMPKIVLVDFYQHPSYFKMPNLFMEIQNQLLTFIRSRHY